MRARWDDVLCLGYRLTGSGAPTPVLRDRIERAVAHFRAGAAAGLTMSGGQGEAEPRPASRAMKEHAVGLGVPPERIAEQPDSLDTVGEALFYRLLAAPPAGARVLVVTSDFHVERAAVVFRFVFAAHAELAFEAVPARPPPPGFDPARERASLAAFRQLSRGLEPGELARLLDRFWREHRLYRGPEHAPLRRRTTAALERP